MASVNMACRGQNLPESERRPECVCGGGWVEGGGGGGGRVWGAQCQQPPFGSRPLPCSPALPTACVAALATRAPQGETSKKQAKEKTK
jgi:hypothetical protein